MKCLALHRQDKNKPILFTMARLDRVKNLTGLVEWFGRNERLRSLVNLVVVGGIVDPAQTSDRRAVTRLSQSSAARSRTRSTAPAAMGAVVPRTSRGGAVYRGELPCYPHL